ncbi:uncharacterized protein LOC142767171 [Rhipicephalus microplus]|uniref:uncharacterized protein LOC142767171 n=1 Tax=Rhipicephalus microplus TaxID=6941 RepID=UPI003F6C1BD0
MTSNPSGTSHAGGSIQSGSHASSKKGAAKKGAKNEVHPEKKDEPPMEVLYTAKDLRQVPVEHVFWDTSRGAPFTGGCLMIGAIVKTVSRSKALYTTKKKKKNLRSPHLLAPNVETESTFSSHFQG